MIEYNPGEWGVGFLFQMKGSVFPKAFSVAFPNAVLAGFMHVYSSYYHQDWLESKGVMQVWGSYTFVLGFLVVFRNMQAYKRYNDGCKLVNETDAEWVDAALSLVTFVSHEAKMKDKVDHFLQLLVRLMSMLHCAALQQVSDMKDDRQDILSPEGIDPAALEYLMQVDDKMEIIMAWLKDLTVTAQKAGILTAPPPILSRALQELEQGQVALCNCRNIRDVSFPFPYAQTLSCMIILHWIVTPILASQAVESWWWCSIVTFAVTFSMWALLYIALQLDQPFGDDLNDLPLRMFQKNFNENLVLMIQPEARFPPTFKLEAGNDKPKMVESDEYWNSCRDFDPTTTKFVVADFDVIFRRDREAYSAKKQQILDVD
eukprot:TRINITY_DN65755_c0_g1_i1.p1 TRINITY_DN65755_c0_g1~~TRINITY_DN65755_c0_g1_i1.p1  ORF type:complete len:373 (+),score=87.41 TRINITY_DN65755_c0_g1_i1:132-1250(+)